MVNIYILVEITLRVGNLIYILFLINVEEFLCSFCEQIQLFLHIRSEALNVHMLILVHMPRRCSKFLESSDCID